MKNKWTNVIRVGWFLALKQIKGSNKATTVLIVFIMMLTFLNLVAVSGILVGLIEGGIRADRKYYTGDVIISTRSGESDILHSHEIEQTLRAMDDVEKISLRYMEGVEIEANYKTRRDFSELRDVAGTQIVGIDPDDEEALTQMSKFVEEGDYLSEEQSGYILLGKNLLHRYSAGFGDVFASLEGVYPGDEVKVTVGRNTQTFIVKGIINSKVDQVSLRAFITKKDFFRLIDRPNLNANEFAIKLKSTSILTPDDLKQSLVNASFSGDGKIKTDREAIPEFLNQIKLAFDLLGNVIGSIGIIVASITIFIVIFINAVTRRKYIGIMKGIGVSENAIEISYVIQSIFYAVLGGFLGIFIVYAILVPFFDAHPLNFPFSDGILVAPVDDVMFKFFLLLVVTIVAGYIPARRIVRQNTLDSILGR